MIKKNIIWELDKQNIWLKLKKKKIERIIEEIKNRRESLFYFLFLEAEEG